MAGVNSQAAPTRGLLSVSVQEAGDARRRRLKCERGAGVWGAWGVGRRGGTTVKNVNLLITEYIAVHLKCCCYANTLGVYFLNPREELSVPCSLLCHLNLLLPPWYLF